MELSSNLVVFFNKIIDALNERKIPYMLSGSVAMRLYLDSRASIDFDFIIHLAPQNIDTFVEKFQDGYYCDKDQIKDAMLRAPGTFNIIEHSSGRKADFIILKTTPFHQKEFSRRVQIDFFGKTIYVVSPEDLLISKLIWIQDIQWPKQMEDIKNLAELGYLDKGYISQWVNTLKLNTFNLLNQDLYGTKY